jgi:hypothetical protein
LLYRLLCVKGTGLPPLLFLSRPVIATSITDSQSNFQEFEENQPSNISKRHRLNTNSSHRGKIFLGGSFRSRLSNLTGAIPSSSTTGPVIATSIAGNQNNFRAIEESQASDVKRRRLNTNDSHRGKNILGVIFGYVYLPLTTSILGPVWQK